MCRESFLNSSNVFLHVGHLKIMAPLCPCFLAMWFPKTPGFWKTLEQLVQLYFSAGSITNCSWSTVSSFSSAGFGMGFFFKKCIVKCCHRIDVFLPLRAHWATNPAKILFGLVVVQIHNDNKEVVEEQRIFKQKMELSIITL